MKNTEEEMKISNSFFRATTKKSQLSHVGNNYKFDTKNVFFFLNQGGKFLFFLLQCYPFVAVYSSGSNNFERQSIYKPDKQQASASAAVSLDAFQSVMKFIPLKIFSITEVEESHKR